MASCRRAVRRCSTWKSNAPFNEIPCGRGQSIETLEDDAGGSWRRPAPRRGVGRRSEDKGQELAISQGLFPRVIALLNVCVKRWAVSEEVLSRDLTTEETPR